MKQIGKWINASNGHRFDVFDPFSNETITDVSNCGPQDAQIVSREYQFSKNG